MLNSACDAGLRNGATILASRGKQLKVQYQFTIFEDHWHENRIRCAVSYDLLLIFHLGYYTYDVVEREWHPINQSIK